MTAQELLNSTEAEPFTLQERADLDLTKLLKVKSK
jgi:hypothetical protein